jgi:predicted chitinase
MAGGAALSSCVVPLALPQDVVAPPTDGVRNNLVVPPERMAERDTVELVRRDGGTTRISIERADPPQDILGSRRRRVAMPGVGSFSGVNVTISENRPAAAASADVQAPRAEGQRLDEIRARELQRVVPGLSRRRAREIAPHLNAAIASAGMTSQKERAAFVAQLAHESQGFSRFEETASGSRYEGRADLGNTERGDGRRYKGRGPIQITGRKNYREAGEALGIDLENHPELASQIDIGFRIAAWYWTSTGISEPARAGDFAQVTVLINGGMTHYDRRLVLYRRALRAIT